MNKYKITLLIIILATLGWIVFSDEDEEILAAEWSIVKVGVDDADPIFLKKCIWGMAGSSEIIFISTRNDEVLDSDRNLDYVFSSGSPIFYKLESDTLKVFTAEVAVEPFGFKSNYVIAQYRLSNIEFIKMGKQYKELGLSKFP